MKKNLGFVGELDRKIDKKLEKFQQKIARNVEFAQTF
jgi:hypothetical protein